MALHEDVEVVVVRGHAVAPVAVEVEADAVEGNVRLADDLPSGLEDRVRDPGLPRVQAEMAGQPRDVDLAVVHLAALGLPLHLLAQLREPVRGVARGDEVRRVDDASPRVVREDGLPGVEQRQQRGPSRHGPYFLLAVMFESCTGVMS